MGSLLLRNAGVAKIFAEGLNNLTAKHFSLRLALRLFKNLGPNSIEKKPTEKPTEKRTEIQF